MKFDLHIHSMYSHDSDAKPVSILKKAKKNSLDGIVITEHNSYEVSAPWDDIFDPFLIILRGVEYKTREGHLLIYGIKSDRYIEEKGKPLKEIAEIAAGEGWALVAAHPFKEEDEQEAEDAMGQNVFKYADLLDALEVNSRCSQQQNEKAIQAAGELGKNVAGGSDAHFASRVGRVYTEFSGEVRTMDDLVYQLKNRQYTYNYLPADKIGSP